MRKLKSKSLARGEIGGGAQAGERDIHETTGEAAYFRPC